MTSPALGVCYYPEHWSEDVWERDAARMAEVGIQWARIGEFAWSRLEPTPGNLTFDWIIRAMDVLGRHGLKVVFGTPTATPPRWMVDKHPDMLAVDIHGRRKGFGSRRHYDFSHLGYREECARITRLLADAVGNHPALGAWQTDNEYGCHGTTYSYSPAAKAGFQTWLAEKYGKPEALNQAWGTVFWSMDYNRFDQIDLPNLLVCEAAPAHDLDFRAAVRRHVRRDPHADDRRRPARRLAACNATRRIEPVYDPAPGRIALVEAEPRVADHDEVLAVGAVGRIGARHRHDAGTMGAPQANGAVAADRPQRLRLGAHRHAVDQPDPRGDAVAPEDGEVRHVLRVARKFSLDVGKAGAARAVAVRIAPLRHEPFDHPVKEQAVVELAAHQRLDLRDVVRREIGPQLDVKRPRRQIDDDDVLRIDRPPFAVAGIEQFLHGVGRRVLGGDRRSGCGGKEGDA